MCFGVGRLGDQRFQKKERLRLRADFERVFAAKCSHGDGVMVVYVAGNGLDWSRLGIVTGKRVGNAVRRNYARRRVREAFRTLKDGLPKGFDIICIANPPAAKKATDVRQTLTRLVTKAVQRWAKVAKKT